MEKTGLLELETDKVVSTEAAQMIYNYDHERRRGWFYPSLLNLSFKMSFFKSSN